MSESRFNGKTGELLRSLLGLGLAALIAYFTSQAAIQVSIANTNARIDVVESKEDAHFSEIQRAFTRIERFMERIEATGQDRSTGEPYSIQRQYSK